MSDLAKGAVAGAFATLFHTAVMYALQPRLPRARRHPLPPVQVTANAARRAGNINVDPGTPLRGATALAHFGFGAAAGGLYAPIGKRFGSVPTGIGYGIGVWAASYLGWIPALRLLPPASRQSNQRNVMMILAHVAWGAALAVAFKRFTEPSRQD